MNEIYKAFESNPIIFGKHYFPHHFRSRSPYFHWLIIRESYENRYFAAQAPRGSAKSTVLALLKPMHRICFKHKRFIVIVQNTYKKAANTLEGIKDEIKWNERIGRDFGIQEDDMPTQLKAAETIARMNGDIKPEVKVDKVENVISIGGDGGDLRKLLEMVSDVNEQIRQLRGEEEHTVEGWECYFHSLYKHKKT